MITSGSPWVVFTRQRQRYLDACICGGMAPPPSGRIVGNAEVRNPFGRSIGGRWSFTGIPLNAHFQTTAPRGITSEEKCLSNRESANELNLLPLGI